MPICGEDDRLKGMITDRDIVVKVLAQGKDPASVRTGEIGAGDGNTITIGADDSIDEALRTMIEHKVRRLPVIDDKRLVGIISQADVATKTWTRSVSATSSRPSQPRRKPLSRAGRAPSARARAGARRDSAPGR